MDPAICIACERPVTNRQQGSECDGCQRWQHRTCGTGITQAEYRAAARAGREIDWRCATCPQIPVLEIQVLPEDGLVQIPVQIPALPALPEALPQLLPELPQEPARPRVSLYVGDLTDFAVPQQLPEPELENPAPRPRPVVPVDGPVTYTIVPASTTMGQKSNLAFYLLVHLLHTEAKMVAITSALVYQEDVTRIQRNGAKTCNARLFALWEDYTRGERSAQSLLSAGSRIICPRVAGDAEAEPGNN